MEEQIEYGTALGPTDWTTWKQQGFSILTPESYQLYRKFTKQILNDQEAYIQQEIDSKTDSWKGTLKTWLQGGFQTSTWMNQKDQPNQLFVMKRKEWKRDRNRWDQHWITMIRSVQTGGGRDIISNQWNLFQNQEAEEDCTYRWNDKIFTFVNDFLNQESKEFKYYLTQKDDSNLTELQRYKWDLPWVERRFQTLQQRIAEMVQERQQFNDPQWTPIIETLNGPKGWCKIFENIKRWDGTKWIREHLTPDELSNWIYEQDKEFLHRSLRLWNSWKSGQDVPWTCQAWWSWFAQSETNMVRGIQPMFFDCKIIWDQDGFTNDVSKQMHELVNEYEQIKHISEPFEQQNWIFQTIPKLNLCIQPINRTNEIVEQILRRNIIMLWIGWKQWWENPIATNKEFLTTIRSHISQLKPDSQDLWKSTEEQNVWK